MSGEVLKKRINVLIEHFDKESTKHKRIHRFCQALVIALTSLTTIVAGSSIVLPGTYNNAIQFSLLVLSATTTGVTGYESMRRARDLWKLERSIHHSLRDLRLQVEWLEEQNLWNAKNQQRIMALLLNLLGESTEDWKKSTRPQLSNNSQIASPLGDSGLD